jgi:hypothetical protein
MSDASPWREFLKELIRVPSERDRLANELGVRPITLTRWASGESNPRPKYIRHLLQILPQEQHAQFYPLLEQDDLILLEASKDNSAGELPYEFVMQVLDTYATIPDTLRSWTIYRLILQHALRQLDPERLGISVTIVQCMPPTSDGMIHSLREITGQGTPPWEGDLEEKSIFLGAESLAGHAVTVFHPEAVQNLQTETTLVPAYQTEHEVSAIASPILLANRVAGCLLISSTQPNYFLSEARLSLIHGYVRLIAFAFEANEFYPPEIIKLNVMPSASVQRELFKTFRQRVHAILLEALQVQQSLSVKSAQQLVWQQLEEELSKTFYSPFRI